MKERKVTAGGKFLIASKIINGEKLTEEEWEDANTKAFFGVSKRATYAGYLMKFYEGGVGENKGLICGNHPTQDLPGDMVCGFGLHLPELKWDHLTDANWYFLVGAFGKPAVEKLIQGYPEGLKGTPIPNKETLEELDSQGS